MPLPDQFSSVECHVGIDFLRGGIKENPPEANFLGQALVNFGRWPAGGPGHGAGQIFILP